jgi:hypothetical protein
LGLFKKTDFIITADHSMMESRAAHSWDQIWKAAAAVHATVARADGEGGPVWLQNPVQAKVVARQLALMAPAHVEAIYYRSAPGMTYRYLRASPLHWLVSHAADRALQDLLNTTAGQNGPDLWVLYRENYTVAPRNVQGVWKGTHGGATWKVQHVPLILSGPGIRQGLHSQFPARAVDIAPTVERLLGLPPIHRDGMLLADALIQRSGGELHAQRALAPTLIADVEALKAQSKADDLMQGTWPNPPQPLFHCGLHAKPLPAFKTCTTSRQTATNQ